MARGIPSQGRQIQVDGRAVTYGSAIPDGGVSRFLWEQDVTDTWGSKDGTDNTTVGYSTDSKEDTYSKEFGQNGEDTIVDIPAQTFSQFSIATWAKFQSTYKDWVTFAGDSTQSAGFVGLRSGGQDIMVIEFDDGTRGSKSFDFSDGNWYHLIYAYDGSTLELYVDGSSLGISSISSKEFTIDNWGIGLANGTNDYTYDGLLDQSDIYSKRLSDTEASNLYSTGSING